MPPWTRRRRPQCRASLLVALASLSMVPGVVRPAAVRAQATPQDSLSPVRALIQQVIRERGIPSVVVASAKGGRIVWEEAFGVANRERQVAATPTTMYSLASISKPFTATGLMVLVQRGAVKLDAPANDYLGAAKLRAFEGRASDATVRRVANHTSGLPTHYQFFYDDERYRPPTMDETISRYGILVSPPGTRANYSNLGFGVIEYIIERTSHTPYPEFMRREVFAPLGLSRTAVVAAPISGDTVAERYDRLGAPISWYDFDHRGASAVYSSAHDLIRFAMFHLRDRLTGQKPILPDSTLDAMHRATARHSELVGYGVGWRTHYEDFGYTGIGHTGGMPGVATLMRIYPEEDAAVVVLTNSADNAAVGQITRAVMSALLPRYGEKAKSFTPPAPVARVPLPRELQGEWRGEVRTWQGTVPLHLSVGSDTSMRVRLGKAAEALMADATWRDTLLTGTFTGTLPADDINRHAYRLRLAVARRGSRLTGAVMAEASPGDGARQYYSLPSWVWLARPNEH
jgi:CubicO group peptidase (beta-lactamase class C family)